MEKCGKGFLKTEQLRRYGAGNSPGGSRPTEGERKSTVMGRISESGEF